MALKKSELYSFLWQSCDELRGGIDASQYKDYVLVLLFVKYVSDRFVGQPFAAITVPEGASFADMVALKGKPDIGDQVNKKILGPLALANNLADMPDFNDPTKLGTGKEMVERLTNLIGIFENPSLDFSRNRADGDDLLGDAYEYLMRHFATESGKSKGQFYTPAEVSRVIAQILGIRRAKATANTTVYDPTCGSGSLLLKVADAAAQGTDLRVTLYGQEKDSSTANLARMNMILHDYATAEIEQGNTLSDPKFIEGAALKTFDYVVANPPFSDKRWSTGLNPEHDPHARFSTYGCCSRRTAWGLRCLRRTCGIGWTRRRRGTSRSRCFRSPRLSGVWRWTGCWRRWLRRHCGRARVSGRCAAALREVEQARREGGHWMDPLEERAEVLALEAGRLLVAAHGRCQEAHGVARAVGLARRGETWTPRDAAETTAWLVDRGAAQGA